MNKTIDIEKPIDAALKDVLEFLSDRNDLTIIVDPVAFKIAEPPLEDVEGQKVRLPKLAGISLANVLQMVLDQVGGTVVLRSDAIFVVAIDQVVKEMDNEGRFKSSSERTEYLRRNPLVYANFVRVSLEDVLESLCEKTGRTIVVSTQVAELAKTPVTVRLVNVSLDTAVRLVTEMTGLKTVAVENAIYVTTPEAAAAFPQSIRRPIPPPRLVPKLEKKEEAK